MSDWYKEKRVEGVKGKMESEEREGAMLLILGGKLGLELVHVFITRW